MKVFFIDNGMTHYYNLVLSKLNKADGVELILIVPKETNFIGDAVHVTREGVDFKVYELEEHTRFGRYVSLKGLSQLISEEKPDVLVVGDVHLLMFIFNIPVILAMKHAGTKLIMKSIPFRLPSYEAAREQIVNNTELIPRFPRWVSILLQKTGLDKVLRYALLEFMKFAYNLPAAHVNYVEDAYGIFGSYGVSRERIFITYNSPDTDKLFQVREELALETPILPICEHRLIHVGRLVEWKRVDLLIRALARIKVRFNDAELLIAGFGPEEDNMRRLSRELNVEDSVHFLGGIYDPAMLGRYFMSSTLYVLAGMGGLSINDAMCFGLPVICSICDGTEKMLVRDGFNGKFFAPHDEDDLVEKITTLFDNPQLLAKMGENSTSIIQNEININTVIQGYLSAFRYVCDHRDNHERV